MDVPTLPPGAPTQQANDLLAQEGFVVLRQVLDAERVRALGAEVGAAFASLDGRKASLDPEDLRLLERLEMPVPQRGERFRLRVENYRVLDSQPLREIIRRWAGGEFCWHFPPMLRRQQPGVPGAALPYHQDFAYTRHYPKFLVCWTPLSPCGEHAPGLELVRGEHRQELAHGAGATWEFGFDPETAESYAARGIAPVLEPGDVVLFTSLTPHRTYLTRDMTKTRLTIDFRAAAAADLTAELRASRRFVDPTLLKFL
ncbi:MAG: phytanoyl-CoA dioxygenase family protein [Planctomycetes bacterium]|nr:phytanoyl-CoA dioxygenase family protein [Planctomycetota bacterium]